MDFNYLKSDLESIAKRIDVLDQLSNSTILVTGATGLVGSLTIRGFAFLNDVNNVNIKIIAQARTEAKVKKMLGDLFEAGKISVIYQDAADKYTIEGNVDYIIHTASPTASKYFVTQPVETIHTAYMGTKQILELARVKKSKGVVYVSSMEVYGVTNPDLPKITEKDLGYIDISKVRSSYSEGKRICELMCVSYANEYGVPIKIARLAQTFGAGVSINEGRVFAQFAKSVINKTDIILHTDGMSEGNYCYTADVIVALMELLVKGISGEAYTVCNEATNTTIANMAKMVATKFGNSDIKVIFDIPQDEMTFGYAPAVKMKLSNEKLCELGWKPSVGLEGMYQRLIECFLLQMER